MRHALLLVLVILAIPSEGQDIERVIFSSQRADEPPTTKKPPLYTIEFKREAGNEWVAPDFYDGVNRKELQHNVVIEKERMDRVIHWQTEKKQFTLSELGLDVEYLKAGSMNYALNFAIPTALIVDVDSFQFCQAYKMTRTISTGGEAITVTLLSTSGQQTKFVFESDAIGRGQLKLKEYLICYTLLEEKVPDLVPGYEFFTKRRLGDIILYYQKTVECEGYYYREYTERNPQMTGREKRMMKGWDFVKYMEERNIQKEGN